MAVDMKIVTFYFGAKDLKYKYPLNSDVSLIDRTLREYFNLSNDSKYYLFDIQDSTFINLSSLQYLNNESKVLIQLKDVPDSSTSKYSSTTHSFSDLEPINLANNPETLTFSDINEKILIDLSSTSSTSESDNNRSSIHCVSKTDQNGGTKLTKAQQKKKKSRIQNIM